MEQSFVIGDEFLDCFNLSRLAHDKDKKISLSPKGLERVRKYRKIVEGMLASGKTFYGINTGFGFLSDVRISEEKLSLLQENYVRSHACAVGKPIAPELVRSLMILRLHTFLLGHGGISEGVCKLLHGMIEHHIMPVVPEKGSVGASGDLAPLAHLAFALVGEGDVFFKSERMNARKALESAGLKPVRLGPKEGLSITNGTHFMAALGAIAVHQASFLIDAADFIAAMSLDAYKGTFRAFDSRIHALKAHPGQVFVAERLNQIFSDADQIIESHKDCGKVQDPYSFRCIPQVHGAARHAFSFAKENIDRELNSVTDNPLVFDDSSIISGGNFHGEMIAMALDFLAIGVSEIGSISEQRIMKLTNPNMSGLPAFLVKDSGFNSGFMIPHVVAASLASENKLLSHPACVDSIPTSADKEDHVSMGPISARKALEVCKNTSYILAIELLAACQGLDLHAPLKTSPVLESIREEIRKTSPFIEEDRSISNELEYLSSWLLEGGLQACLKENGFTRFREGGIC